VGTLESCEFVGNSASDAGGAISVHGGILVANDCLFEANTTSGSYSQGGGALYVAPGNWTSGSASISGSTFTSNGAADLGGAISLDGVLGDVGSGLYVTGTTFEGNHAPRGGAIATIAGGGAEIADCVFDANTAVIDGGALNFGGSNSLHVTGSTFTGNIAGERGGAVFDGAGPWGVPSTYSSCTFAQNEATAGGALALESDSFRIENSLIAMNASTDGAGLHVTGSILYQEVQDIVACRFIGNVATGLGGGVFVSASGPRIVSSLLTGNSAEIGGGLYNQDAAWTQVINATFAGNGALFGGGIGNLSSNPEVWNSILWGNTAAQGPQVRNIAGSAPLFAHSDVQGSGGSAGWNGSIGGDGGGNIEADPQFVDADGPDGQFGTSDDDVRLLPSSPCIDAASLAAHPSGFDTDVYGAPRLIDGDGDCAEAIDIGAAEEQSGGGAVDLHISAGSFASAVSAAGLVLTDLEDLSGHNGASQGYFALAPATDLNPGAPNVNPATQLGFPAGLAGTMGIGARDYQGAPLTLWVMPAAASGLPTDLVGNEIEAVGDNRDLVLWPAPGTLALGFDLHILQTNDTNECMIRVIEVDGCTVELNFVFATLPPYASFVGVRSDVGIERVEIDYAGVEAIANVQSWGIEITPPCPADISADGLVGLADLLAVLAAWGPCAVGAPCQGANVATDGTSAGAVDFADLLLVLTAWGTCPE